MIPEDYGIAEELRRELHDKFAAGAWAMSLATTTAVWLMIEHTTMATGAWARRDQSGLTFSKSTWQSSAGFMGGCGALVTSTRGPAATRSVHKTGGVPLAGAIADTRS